MYQLRKVLAVALLVAVLSGLATSAALAQDPANGKVVWEEQLGCKNCHGDAGEGKWAGPLAGNTKTVQEWVDQVRNPRRNMPHFSDVNVSDAMIADVHAYLTSLPKVENFTPIDPGLPADAPQGQVLLVEKRCAACHSTTGAINGFIKRGELPTVEAVTMQVRTPRQYMPAFFPEQVSDAELALIADFMIQEVSAQMAPAALPQSGGDSAPNWPLWLLAIGGVAAITGLGLRRLLNS